jgi:hypothetical protein
MTFRPVSLVQLPFPSQREPEPSLDAYYAVHGRLFHHLVSDYRIGDGDLWEAPLWVAHLDGAIGRDDTSLLDLSRVPAAIGPCTAVIEREAPQNAYLFFSPLAQNFDLAIGISRALRGSNRLTVLGGNMSRIASVDDFDVVFHGQVSADLLDRIDRQRAGIVGTWPRRGRSQPRSGFRPRYRLLRDFGRRVPLVRLNASHGCLFSCTFCGDGWSRQLHVVPYEDLAGELDEIEATFPAARCIYIGDKTFGQSRAAVENLIRACAHRKRYHIIVQTHVTMVDDWLLDALDRLGADIVEMGMETADAALLRQVNKRGSAPEYRTAIERLQSRGKAVTLNVLGGLPYQTDTSHAATLAFLRDTTDIVYSYNLYNFVPYPETPLFEPLKPRIVDWCFSNWREDRPAVYQPFTLSRERAWEQFLELIAFCTEASVARLAGIESRTRAAHG